MAKKWVLLAFLFVIVLTRSTWAQDLEPEPGFQVPASQPGLVPGQGQPVTSRLAFSGYGEIHYNNPGGSSTVPRGDSPAEMDFHRFVIGLNYQFSDRMILYSEIDFEHASKEMELEFAYIDFLVTPALNIRAGSMLMPVGPLNEFHEPPLFYSVERPYVQTFIIPTTWQEGGIGLFGAPVPGLRYRIYLVSSLNAGKFSSRSGLRGGRGTVAEAASEDLALVGRVEYVGIPGIDFGISAYQGGANATKDPALGDAAVGILEGDARARFAGLDLRAVYVQVKIDDADRISAVKGEIIGEELAGWYLEGAYHLNTLFDTKWDLVPFARLENFNTQEAVPAGLAADPANDREVLTVGAAFYPTPLLAVKADRERWEDGTGADGIRFNLGFAYMF